MRISDWISDVCSSDLVCVWRVFHKRSGHEFTIADGCKDYLRPPAAPVPRLERFWNIFTLSFNDIEDATDIYPPPSSEASRVGKEWVSTCRREWSQYH